MAFIAGMVFLAIPLIINVVAVWQWRGGYRYAALIPLPFLAIAFAVDLNGMIQGGNLAGIFSIMAIPPALLFLLVLSAVQGTTQESKKSTAMAVASTVVVFSGIVFVTYGLLIYVDELNNVGYWVVGASGAGAVAFLSFRQNMKRG